MWILHLKHHLKFVIHAAEIIKPHTSVCLCYICDSFAITCFVCRFPACDPLAGPSSQLLLWTKHRRGQEERPPAWFTFPRGRTSPVSQNLLPFRVSSTLPSWDIPLSSAPESIRRRKTATAAATLGYSTVWVENILWCLISTVGKAILTKPINPWASDGTDLIPPAADVPSSLCSAVLRYPALWCALHSTLHRPETQILTVMQRAHL